jgi:hypothetical protein
MTLCHTDLILESPAIQRLGQFMQDRRQQWALSAPDFERFERELHDHLQAIECEFLAEELAHYDVRATEIEVGGVPYRPTLMSAETYLSAAGPVKVARHLYRPAGRGSRSICPLELRAGIIAGQFTPRAARQAAFVVAHLTPGESEALFDELAGMRPSRSSLDRLPKELSQHWERQRADWEAALRLQEMLPAQAAVLAISVDGVMAPMKGPGRNAKRDLPGKHASGPAGNKEVGCGTVVLYDAEGERLQTVRYGRMPESKKVTLQHQLAAEVAQIVAQRPDVIRVHLADGAKDNWRLMADLEQDLGQSARPTWIEIVDFYHACDHLKNACDAAWGDSTPRGKAEFERLRSLLKEADDGVERVIRVVKYQRSRTSGQKRTRLDAELTYFRNQRRRMHYADYVRQKLPIASGVMEASCKTLVTQRLKCSGMAWTPSGGQAILTLRSLIQSDRWHPAWDLLRADFCQTVVISESPSTPAERTRHASGPSQPSPQILAQAAYAALPLAV